MGYEYRFQGHFSIRPALTAAQREYLKAFAETRRVKRCEDKLIGVADPVREAVGLPIGNEGAYFVGNWKTDGEEAHGESVLNSNTPPSGQPSLYCDWLPDETGEYLGAGDDGKFNGFDEWLEYLITHFLIPWGCVLDGEVAWQGEDFADTGTLVVRENIVDALGVLVVNAKKTRRLRVFVCHASEDKARARKLVTRLCDDNIDAWIDEHRLLPGSDWELEIRTALREADAVIVCLSPTAVKKRGFVQREIRIALSAFEEQPQGARFVFPVCFATCAIPDALTRFQRVDLGRRGSYLRLLGGLAARADELSDLSGAGSTDDSA